VPGAPRGLNWWEGPQFRMSDLMAALPPPAPPPPPLAPTVTPQDIVARTPPPNPSDPGGAQPGGGGPGGGPGGLGPGPSPGQANPGMGGGVYDPGGNLTFSGYPGVYSQSPVDINSQFATGLGLAGAAVPFPGAGTALGALGGYIDASRYNATNAQYGLPGTVNPWGSAAAAALAGIGVPFTDINLAHLFGVPTARERQDALINAAPPGLYNDMGYGALAANAPVGPATVGSPPSASYPPGFADWNASLAVVSPVEDPNAPMPTSSFFGGLFGVDPTAAGKGDFDAGGWGAAQADKGGEAAGSTGSASDKGADASRGGDVSGSSGYGGDNDGGEYARGGMIGAPPGRYAAGGIVSRAAGNMPTRREFPPIDVLPRDYMSDTPAGGAYMNDQPMEPPPPSVREQMIQDAMQDYLRGRNRTGYPEQFAAGGSVMPPQAPGANITPAQFGMLRAIDPPGPDDQIGALQTGEGVLTRAAIARYPGLLDAANAGKLDPAKVQGLLAGAPKPTPRPRNKLKGASGGMLS